MHRLIAASLFAMLLTASPVTIGPVAGPGPVEAHGCGHHHSATKPPKWVYVFRIHRRGSSIPARVERWDLDTYVGVVMESGAWPRRPRQSALVGAAAIKQYAWWHVLHHQRGYSWRGKCYDIRDGDQYIRPPWRPHMLPSRLTRSIVAESWDIRLIKNGRLFRPGWRGGAGNDSWHLYEDSITRLARRGWSAKRLLNWALSPVRIHGL